MGKPAPDPTPPRETSAAQTGSSVSTAIANAFLTNMDEVTPNGTRTFDQTGSFNYTDPFTEETYDIPRFTSTVTLSPEQQAIQAQNDAASQNLASLGRELSVGLRGQLNENFSLGNDETESRLFELGSARLDPKFEQGRESLRTQLTNQGIRQGSEAYDREMARFGETENDAYNQLLLQGRGMASQELLTEDNQRINQISALLNGGQVAQPSFLSSPNVNPIQGTDNAAIIGNADNAAMNSWQQTQAARGSLLGGIGGLFSLSDERAKKDKVKIGETDDGLGIYSFKYKGEEKTSIGLMAQEVKKKKPGAVATRPDGLFAVDYEKALA